MVLSKQKSRIFSCSPAPVSTGAFFVLRVYMDKIFSKLLTADDQIIMVLLNRGYVIVNTQNKYTLTVDLRLQKAGV